jgi:hypothetical protein
VGSRPQQRPQDRIDVGCVRGAGALLARGAAAVGACVGAGEKEKDAGSVGAAPAGAAHAFSCLDAAV